jgi:hypothetical protein
MMALTHGCYYDRYTGELKRDPIFARGFLHWLHNTAPGWFLNEYLFSRSWVSRFYGWLNKRRWSRRKIKSFARRLEVNLDELSRPI